MTRALAGISIAAVALVAIACAGGPGDPDGGSSSPGGEGGTVTAAPAGSSGSSGTGSPEASVDPSARFHGPTRVTYTQFAYGGVGCEVGRVVVTADLDARTLVAETQSCGDSGASDGGTTVTRPVTLSDTDAQSLRALASALRRDPAAPTTCNGFDGTEKEFAVTTATETFTARTGWICSAPSAPDVIVEAAGFGALHAKLMTLAGLDPSFPPT